MNGGADPLRQRRFALRRHSNPGNGLSLRVDGFERRRIPTAVKSKRSAPPFTPLRVEFSKRTRTKFEHTRGRVAEWQSGKGAERQGWMGACDSASLQPCNLAHLILCHFLWRVCPAFGDDQRHHSISFVVFNGISEQHEEF